MKKVYLIISCLFFIGNLFAQNIGINNADPKAALDIDGGFRTRAEVVNVTSAFVAIPSNKSIIFLDGSFSSAFSMTIATSYKQDGTRIIVYNNTNQIAQTDAGNINSGELVEIIYFGATGFKFVGKNVTPPPSAFQHYVGELFGGGIVVSVWKTAGVEHGLIASLTDISIAAALTNVNVLIGPTAQSHSNGFGNTMAIINQPGHINSAAKLCRDYTGGGFTDWYLPAAWELHQIFNVGLIVNTVLSSTNGMYEGYISDYWSSTEYPATSFAPGFVRFMSFNGGSENAFPKTNVLRVRAVRRY
jgi:trimeric autotransporter adhesin